MPTSSAVVRAEGSAPAASGLAAARHRLGLAAAWVARGGLIAYPTEAVYGLGCDPENGHAVRRLLALKARPEHKGLILIAADWAQLEPYVRGLGQTAMAAIHATWPGAVTWLLPARRETPRWLTGEHQTLAVRVTAHPLAAALCRQWGGPWSLQVLIVPPSPLRVPHLGCAVPWAPGSITSWSGPAAAMHAPPASVTVARARSCARWPYLGSCGFSWDIGSG